MADLSKIKDLAYDKHISIVDLAKKIGLTPQAMQLMFKTNSTKIETLEKIAEVLEVNPAVFFTSKFPVQSCSVNINENGIQNSPNSVMGNDQSELIAMLKSQIKDKDDLLKVYRALYFQKTGETL